MSGRYPNVFKAIQLGPVTVRNRFYFSPHGNPTWLLSEGNGRPSDDFAAYFAERAAGGVGLLFHSLAAVPRISMARQCPYFEHTIPAFASVAERVHKFDSKIFAQLHYSQGLGTGNKWDKLSPPGPELGASSAARYIGYHTTRQASPADLAALLEALNQSTRNLAKAGYDGFQLNATHGMIFEQFLSPRFNRRDDSYGGSASGRMRLVVEALLTIRQGAGDDKAVGIRLNCDEMVPGGLGTDDVREIVGELAHRGLVDFIDLDVALEPDQMEYGMPPDFMGELVYKPYVQRVRSAAGSVPVLSALGRVLSVEKAEEELNSGTVDMVGAARALIAEPALLENALAGKEEQSRTCIGTNLCVAMSRYGTWGCAINPISGRESDWSPLIQDSPDRTGRVIVVGGGPAGLEAARVSASRGHEVILLERTEYLGGQLALWGQLPGRGILLSAPSWWQARLRELEVDIRTGVTCDTGLLLAEQPDAVVLATGAKYARGGITGINTDDVPGSDRHFVYTPEQILQGEVQLSGRVLVIDDEGFHTAVGIAEQAARSGCEVDIVTRFSSPGGELAHTWELDSIQSRLRHLGVGFQTFSEVVEIGDRRLTIRNRFTRETVELDGISGIVMATRRLPQVSFDLDDLEEHVAQVFTVGDALSPRSLVEAVYEGHYFARMIGREGSPRDSTEAFWDQTSLLENR